ncbi:immunoglobulin-binding protein 1 [Silurus asotus]|nr:immunoglobulin-binding protein 1 [Silurus asotus]
MASAEESVQAEGDEAQTPKLSEMLESGWRFYEELEKSQEPLNSEGVQRNITRAVQQLQQASRMLDKLHLFSHNEELDEISTADLKFVLLPALLAALVMKQGGVAQRLERVQTARVHFLRFLRLCKDYNISSFHLPPDAQDTGEPSPGAETDNLNPAHPAQPDLIAMATQRQAKIERYKQQKQVEQKLADLRLLVDGGSVDEEVMREFYLLQVRRWITVALEEIESIDQEVQILRRMPALTQAPRQKPRRAPMKPFILTKDAVQAKVFGEGYPSLPTMTVNEWYEQHQKKGCLPDQGIPQSTVDVDAEEREKEEKERKEEEDDEEALQKARDWDNWKDTHRRGYGNRQNMG